MIYVVIAYRSDGRLIVLSDTQEVQVLFDYPDEDRAPEVRVADWAPTVVADVVERMEEEA